MNESNSKFQKNPFPWLALMTVWSVMLACLCGYIGGCTQRGKAEDRLHDDRLEAKLKLQAASELEAKSVMELQKLRKEQKEFEEKQAKFRAEQNQKANEAVAKRDSFMKAQAKNSQQAVPDSASPTPSRVILKGSLLKVKDTGRSIFDLDAAKNDKWHNWFARFHYVLEGGEFRTISVSVGELSVIQSEERIASVETGGSPDVEGVLRSLNYDSPGKHADRKNGDQNRSAQVYVHIPLEEFNKYVELYHND